MRHLSIIGLLIASSMLWQQKSAPATANVPTEHQALTPQDKADQEEQQGLPESAAKVAPDAAVITIQGLCPPTSSVAAENVHPACQTQISRTQFEKLADAVLANKQTASRQRQLAQAYPSLLAMAQAAEARGLENDPRFQQRIAFARLQILSQELVRQIEQESAKIPPQEIEDYYHTHSAEFDAVTLERIYVPNRKDSETQTNQLAEKLRARALTGESFSTLQKDAYASAGMTEVPPNSSLGAVHANSLPPGHAFALDLKVGEVSQVFSDSTGHYIYKLDAKETGLSEKTGNEVRRLLERQHRDKAIQSIERPVTPELNPAYFGPADKPGAAGGPDTR